MNKMSYVKKSIITAACIALCVILPMAFHAIPNGGSIFSPMHIPVLLCGLICGPLFGLLCGIAGPCLSSLLTGMPGIGYLPVMIIELAAYGLIAGIMISLIRTKKIYADLYISLIIALILGRVVAGIFNALIFSAGSYSLAVWASGYFITSIPGMILHLAIIPTIVFALEKSRLIPKRYPKVNG